MNGFVITLLLVLPAFLAESRNVGKSRQFAIIENNFVMDGEPFQYVSGSMHYFRCPKVYWRDRLRKMREAGLNAVSTYAEWSQHEIVPGQFNFSGELNITEFIRIAAEEELYVILRPGPYICAERDMGGLPYWLLQKNPDVALRTSDIRYTEYVKRWLDVLMTELEPALYGNGGPIIMVQVENEYGSYYACDQEHLIWLRDLFRGHVGDKAQLFTTDGAGVDYLKCGKIPGVYATVDFGSGTNVTKAFAAQRAYEKTGPLVNSEYYPGWLTHWGEKMATVQTEEVAKTLSEMLSIGASLNFYMFHGGTNFGFTAGANYGSKYQSDLTSYDYDAPLTEAGDITEKYKAIRDVLLQYFPNRRKERTTPDVALKANYGQVTLKATASLFSPQLRAALGGEVSSQYPMSFESLGQNFGYLLYETTIPSLKRRKVTKLELKVPIINDRGIVYVNGERVGKLSREQRSNRTMITVQTGDRLGIMVENLGRINYGTYINDSKGILSNVTLGGVLLKNWTLTKYELKDVTPVETCQNCLSEKGFTFYSTKFSIVYKTTEKILPDTFVDVSGLEKGLVYINGFNLGRYWSTRGPQFSLYLPGIYLKEAPAENSLVILDEKIDSDTIQVSLVDTHVRIRS